MKRRSFLQYASVGAAATIPGLSFAEQLVTTETISGQKYGLITVDGVNTFVANSDNGQIIVDSGKKENIDVLKKSLVEFGGNNTLYVNTLFNTHYHSDQTGGNESFGKLDTKIIAHKKTQLHLATDYYMPKEERYHRASPKAALPTHTFYNKESSAIGGIDVEAGLLVHAHTVGDIYVRFKDANIICAGDAISPQRDPEIDWRTGAWLGGRRDSLDLLLSISDDNTQFIPAYGPVMTKKEVAQEKEFTVAIYEEMSALFRDGQTAQDMLNSGIMSKVERELTDPFKFLYDAHKGFWAHYNKIAPNIV